jgi:hypothetical protein
MSTEPTWKVYLPEWLIVYTSDAAGGLEGGAECRQHFHGKHRGRVRGEDWRVVPAIAGAERERHRPYCLQLRLPNLHGEFKDYSDAVQLASELVDDRGGVAHVVQRGSPEERELLDYGRKMLPGAG